MADLSELPSDDSLLAEIRDILKTADLMAVTKKSVKLELERRFNVNLDAKRTYINSGKITCAFSSPITNADCLFYSYRGRSIRPTLNSSQQ